MISGLYGAFRPQDNKDAQRDDICVIHRNRIKNEVERLKSHQCRLDRCDGREDVEIDGESPTHFHVNNVTIFDKTDSRNYILVEISLVINHLDSFNTNVIPVEIVLYRDFPFSFPDITFPTTCCFPSLSDGRSFTVEVLSNDEWSPGTTLLDVVDSIKRFLVSYSQKISTVGSGDLYIGSYRSPISFNYQCSNSLVYPILESSITLGDDLYAQVIQNHPVLKSSYYDARGAAPHDSSHDVRSNPRLGSLGGLVSRNGGSIVKSLIPIPLNTKGITRETLKWRFERPNINTDFVFDITNVMLFDSVLLIIEKGNECRDKGASSSVYGNGVANLNIVDAISCISQSFLSGKNKKLASSSCCDEVPSDSVLQGNVVMWLYLSMITHIFDSNGRLIFGNKGTVPEQVNSAEHDECVVIVLGYDALCEKSNLSFYFQNELVRIPERTSKPVVLKLRFHKSKARHENSCCSSFSKNITEKVRKVGSHYPENCYNPAWDSYFRLKLLENLNDNYLNAISANRTNLSSQVIYKWVVISSKLVELASLISETDEDYLRESDNLVRKMQQVLASDPVRSILDSNGPGIRDVRQAASSPVDKRKDEDADLPTVGRDVSPSPHTLSINASKTNDQSKPDRSRSASPRSNDDERHRGRCVRLDDDSSVDLNSNHEIRGDEPPFHI